ncbi:filamentous hemagglutinin N-terminal domain-containing protein [Xenorhabdus bovienii]|uniref:two-partner secretion domain-containing protein n=1 Tax=Xenorhabdus bovienii TaxID=40576 RepID=UPI0023B2CAFE|nr:filamentous hemagglutinin N-terminal domain-containing protein [Xenorhabdus bovienii]MDE9427761.1 filamentous hemagglutinin N-terminal domain-containing protein [Xenorhabdus bovienii]
MKNSKIFVKTLLASIVSLSFVTSALANSSIPNDNQTRVHMVNNIEVVDIVNPDDRGFSFNNFKEFNVNEPGMVLNNSVNGTVSQLAGQLNKNSNLSKPARVIVSNVTGGNFTQLKGMLEVAGDRAAILIANPNGIVANGASFSNTNHVQLSTSTHAIVNKGDPATFQLIGGKVVIGEKGIDSTNVDNLTIESRAIDLNGMITGKTVSLDTNSILAGTGIGNPEISIDTGALGGIYANKIIVKSNEKGTGVNLSNLTGTESLLAEVRGTANLSGQFRGDNSLFIFANKLNKENATFKTNGFPIVVEADI